MLDIIDKRSALFFGLNKSSYWFWFIGGFFYKYNYSSYSYMISQLFGIYMNIFIKTLCHWKIVIVLLLVWPPHPAKPSFILFSTPYCCGLCHGNSLHLWAWEKLADVHQELSKKKKTILQFRSTKLEYLLCKIDTRAKTNVLNFCN